MSHCYACHQRLLPVDNDPSLDAKGNQALADRNHWWDNALIITLHGGYGMFIDPDGQEPADPSIGILADNHVVVCHECAHRMCEALPWINRLIGPACSHTHKSPHGSEGNLHEH